MKKKASGLHKISLAALFTVGVNLIRYPWRQPQEQLLPALAVSLVGALIPAVLLYPGFQKLYRKPLSCSRWRSVCAGAVGVSFFLYAAILFCQASKEYLLLLENLVLPNGPTFALPFFFVLCSLLVALLPGKGLDSFALLSFLFCFAAVLSLLFAGRDLYTQVPNLLVPPQNFALISGEVLGLWKESLLPLSVLSLYFALSLPKGGERALAAGTAAGYGFLLICILQTLLTFGQDYAASLNYPYAYAVRVISVGPYFFRLEGIAYLFDFLGALFRTGVSLACIKRICARFFPNLARGCTATVAAVCLVVLYCWK